MGISREKARAEWSRRRRRRSLRKTASTKLRRLPARWHGDLRAQPIDEPLERVLRHRRIELGAEVSRQTHALYDDVDHAPPVGCVVERIVDGEAVARRHDLGRHLRLVAGELLAAEREVRRVEKKQALDVRPHEEDVEQIEELLNLGVAPALEMRARGEPRERIGIEEGS